MIHGDAMYYDVVMARAKCYFRLFILGDFQRFAMFARAESVVTTTLRIAPPPPTWPLSGARGFQATATNCLFFGS